MGILVTICNDPPPMTQYCPLLPPPNQTSQEVTYSEIALTETRLTSGVLIGSWPSRI
jgi:hypothetical protein